MKQDHQIIPIEVQPFHWMIGWPGLSSCPERDLHCGAELLRKILWRSHGRCHRAGVVLQVFDRSCLSGALQSAGLGQSLGDQQPRDPLEFGNVPDWSRRHQGGEAWNGGGHLLAVVNGGGAHSLVVVKGLQSINNPWILQAFKWEDLEFFEPAVSEYSQCSKGGRRSPLLRTLASGSDWSKGLPLADPGLKLCFRLVKWAIDRRSRADQRRTKPLRTVASGSDSSKEGGTAAPETCLTTSTYSKYFEISLFEFKLPQYSLHQDSTLNAFHGGQAWATALKSNKTVVDINLAGNYDCGNEGAEACEPIWDELAAGGFDLPDADWHWQTLTLTHFSEQCVDGCCFC